MYPDERVESQQARSGPRSAQLGFTPAFFDYATCTIYASRFADGRAAPLHILDGLPAEVVVCRAPDGRVVRMKSTVISGFERNGFFYTRTAAAKAIAEWAGLRGHA